MKKKTIFCVFLLFLLCISNCTAKEDQQRIEYIQWYTDWGQMDVYEIKHYDEKGLLTGHLAILNDEIVESSFFLYSGDKVISYDIEGKINSITETAGNKKTHYYYFNGNPVWRTECIYTNNKTRYIHYHSGNMIDTMYDEIVVEENKRLTRWLNPENEEVIREEMTIERYDENDLLVYEENLKYESDGMVSIIKEYSYDISFDERGRPVVINRFILENDRKRLVYILNIKYPE